MSGFWQYLQRVVARSRVLVTGSAGADRPRNPAIDDEHRDRYQRLLQDYHIRGKLLEVSNRILASGYGASTLEEAFASVIRICMEAIGGDTSVIELLDEENGVLVGVATDYGGYRPEGFFSIPLQEQALSTLAFHQRQTVAIDDVITDPRVSQRIRRIFGARSGIAAPLLIDGKAIGVLLTMSSERQINFSGRDELLMEGLAELTSLAVHTQRMRKQRIQTEYRFQTLMESAPAAIFLLDQDLRILEANRSAETLLGYDSDRMLTMNLQQLVNDPDHRDNLSTLISATAETPQTGLETSLRRHDGSSVPVEMHVNTLTVAGRLVYQLFAHNISQRQAAEAHLREERERAVVTLQSIGDAVLTTDRNGRCTGINLTGESLLGISSETAIGADMAGLFQIIHESDKTPVPNLVHSVLRGKSFESPGDLLLRCSDGTEKAVELSAAPIRSGDKGISGVVIVIRDVGPTRRIAQEMAYLARHDTLTGLINRREFERRVSHAIETARRNRIQHVICYLDLDRFKVVNDTCGHMAGDELLQQLSQVLKANIRTSDTFARLGGDEFGLLLENCPLGKGQALAEEICSAVGRFRYIREGREFNIGVSIGVTAITADSADLPRVLSTVDAACYAAKDAGRNQVQVYEPDDRSSSRSPMRINWLDEIQSALAQDRLLLFRQPIIPLQSDALRPHWEVLLRMRSTRGDLISPDIFIGTAERYHLMPEIDRWVIANAMQHIAQANGNGEQVQYNINLSGQSLGDEGLLEFILDRVSQWDIRPETICFEITETAAIADATHASNMMRQLSERGFKFALDDFGSGLSSFSYLKYLNVDYLKIDGNFVRDMVRDNVDVSIVASINAIAHAMGLYTVAEFAENEQIIMLLRDSGIDYAQGYGVGSPAPFLDR